MHGLTRHLDRALAMLLGLNTGDYGKLLMSQIRGRGDDWHAVPEPATETINEGRRRTRDGTAALIGCDHR